MPAERMNALHEISRAASDVSLWAMLLAHGEEPSSEEAGKALVGLGILKKYHAATDWFLQINKVIPGSGMAYRELIGEVVAKTKASASQDEARALQQLAGFLSTEGTTLLNLAISQKIEELEELRYPRLPDTD